jgi:signal transduction histidine kinase
VEPVPIEVGQVVHDAVEALSELAAHKGVALSAVVEPRLPRVPADRERVMQVLANLGGNAVKFTPAGGAVELRAEREADAVRVSCTDTGPGIAAEDLPHVFDRFWQARSTRRAGAGLGLAIAKGIVEAHGGEITAESTPGEGSTFSFTLSDGAERDRD